MSTAKRMFVACLCSILVLGVAHYLGLPPSTLFAPAAYATGGQTGGLVPVGGGTLAHPPSDFSGPGEYIEISVVKYYTSLSAMIHSCGEGNCSYTAASTKTFSLTRTSSTAYNTAAEISTGLGLSAAGATATILTRISGSITKTIGTAVSVAESSSIVRTRSQKTKKNQCVKLEGWILTYRALIIWHDCDSLFNDSGVAVLIWYANDVRVTSTLGSCSTSCPLKHYTAYTRRPTP